MSCWQGMKSINFKKANTCIVISELINLSLLGTSDNFAWDFCGVDFNFHSKKLEVSVPTMLNKCTTFQNLIFLIVHNTNNS